MSSPVESIDKINSAEFAEQREQAMLRSRKAGNPNSRLVPEMSKSAKAARTNVEPPMEVDPPATHEDSEPPTSDDDDVDFSATSAAILDALRRIKNHVDLTAQERTEACAIIGGSKTSTKVSHPIILSILCVIIGLVVGMALSSKK